ncbi:MAG: SOS response-associated peptidase [Kofleriaceae bacterium]|nr:SOS response-associated peptidase [Kofleriaceae bacterium]MCL4228303.1 SOS response-associated peptidase [Myxococcales bacterium]
MCGRYTVTTQQDLIAEMDLVRADDASCAGALAVAPGLPAGLTSWWAPRWNVAPTQPAPVVLTRAGRATLGLLRWGLVPHWADDLAIGVRHINARAETAAGKPAFRDSLRRRRCLVAADGFYEWRRDGKRRVPHWFGPGGGGPVTFAAIWDRWRRRDAPAGAPWVESFAILTTAAAPLVAPLHERMPVVVAAADRARWLAADDLPAEAVTDLLAPGAAVVAGWIDREVEPWVNDARRERGDPAG